VTGTNYGLQNNEAPGSHPSHPKQGMGVTIDHQLSQPSISFTWCAGLLSPDRGVEYRCIVPANNPLSGVENLTDNATSGWGITPGP